MSDLRVDPSRTSFASAVRGSGLYVRAIGPDGRWGSHDILLLDRDSLIRWLRDEPARAEEVIASLFGHQLAPKPGVVGPFVARLPAWVNGPPAVGPEAQLVRAEEAAHAIYGLLAQTGVHAMIEWCGVLGEHVKMLKAAHAQGVDVAEANQHSSAVVTIEPHLVAYLCEKLGCQLKPFIRGAQGVWLAEVGKWFTLPHRVAEGRWAWVEPENDR